MIDEYPDNCDESFVEMLETTVTYRLRNYTQVYYNYVEIPLPEGNELSTKFPYTRNFKFFPTYRTVYYREKVEEIRNTCAPLLKRGSCKNPLHWVTIDPVTKRV